MTLITDLPLGTSDGAEEYVISRAGVEYKITGTQILAAITATYDAHVISNNADIASLTTNKVEVKGDTMTGYLTLVGDPSAALHAATKQYVDGLIATKADATGAVLDATATGVTAVDTTESTVLATTEYVGSKIEYETLKKTNIASSPVTLAYTDRGVITVAYTATAPTIINLPQISALTSSERTEYYIIDTGLNAYTNNITINAYAGDTINGVTSYTIATNGESVALATSGGTAWFVKDVVSSGSQTISGIMRYATTAEAKALTSTATALAPATLNDVLGDTVYKYEQIGAATEIVVEADAGTAYYVTYTSTGTVAITLPDPAGLTTPGRFIIEIWDAATAGTNNITITPSGGLIDGAASFTIANDRAGLKLYTDGTNYFSLANTARATAAAIAATTTDLSSVLAIGNTTGAYDIKLDAGQSLIFNNSGFTATIAEPTLAADIVLTLPNATGTIATTATTLSLTGGTMTGSITMASGQFVKLSNSGFTGSLGEGTYSANRVYTFPDATGTVALTSDLTAYLPLAGGTIVGSIVATTAIETLRTASNGWISFDGATNAKKISHVSADNALVISNSTASAGESVELSVDALGHIDVEVGGTDIVTVSATGLTIKTGQGGSDVDSEGNSWLEVMGQAAVMGIGVRSGGGHLAHTIQVYDLDSAYDSAIGGDFYLQAGNVYAIPAVANIDGGFLYLQSGLNAGTGNSSIIFQTGQSVGASTRATLQTYMIIDGTDGMNIGTVATQKLAFYNGTPSVQDDTGHAASTFAANTSGIANDTATWDGYTIGQIVKILRDKGLIA